MDLVTELTGNREVGLVVAVEVRSDDGGWAVAGRQGRRLDAQCLRRRLLVPRTLFFLHVISARR